MVAEGVTLCEPGRVPVLRRRLARLGLNADDALADSWEPASKLPLSFVEEGAVKRRKIIRDTGPVLVTKDTTIHVRVRKTVRRREAAQKRIPLVAIPSQAMMERRSLRRSFPNDSSFEELVLPFEHVAD